MPPRPINPFISGPPASPERFVGRRREVSIILDRLANPYNRGGSAISGPEGIGKTSLLHYVTSELALRDWPALPADIARFVFMPTHLFVPFSETDFWLYLFSDLQKWLRGKYQDKARELIEKLEAGRPLGKFEIPSFFGDLGKESGDVVVVMLDGFDILLKGMRLHDPEDATRHFSFLHTLRGLLNLPAPRGFSLITASERPLFDLFAEAESKEARWLGSDFYSNMAILPLKGFSPEDINELLMMYLADTGVEFTGADRDRLIEQSSAGLPRDLQHAAHVLFEEKVAIIEETQPEEIEEASNQTFHAHFVEEVLPKALGVLSDDLSFTSTQSETGENHPLTRQEIMDWEPVALLEGDVVEIEHLLTLIDEQDENRRLAEKRIAEMGGTLQAPTLLLKELKQAEEKLANHKAAIKRRLEQVFGREIASGSLE